MVLLPIMKEENQYEIPILTQGNVILNSNGVGRVEHI